MAICNDMKQKDGAVGLVTELMEKGSLYTLLHDSPAELALSGRLRLAVDIVDGMRFLHHSRLIHRDLKSTNVLVQSDGRAKIADFGLSRFRDASATAMTGVVGTAAWSAPESLREDRVRASSDVYSFGVILWELCTRQVPWAGRSVVQIITQVVSLNKTLELPPVSAFCTEPLRDMMRRCLLTEAAQRPSFDQLYSELSALLLEQLRSDSETLQRVPDAFLCPISMEITVDPVMCVRMDTATKRNNRS